MLVAGNDRVQAVITQMEEVCQTIEVSLGWEDKGDRTVHSPRGGGRIKHKFQASLDDLWRS